MTTANAPVPTTMGASGKALGKSYFDCDRSTFNGCFNARSKGKHWKTYLGKDADLTGRIKSHFENNKNDKSILLRHNDSYLNINRSSNSKDLF